MLYFIKQSPAQQVKHDTSDERNGVLNFRKRFPGTFRYGVY